MKRKIKIIFACWGTVVGIAIVSSMLLILFGMEEKIEVFFYLHFSVGAVIVFILFWPFYSKRMK
ncbi:hypothetical protein [Desulfosudis oleivorans]|uniref:hypothetical protein n=1 Tax=Desulfosudis oleivorans TaxID=181663 RepID=UPI00059E6B61|nr:hypothetical protein [Desulfosudis oleivorans]